MLTQKSAALDAFVSPLTFCLSSPHLSPSTFVVSQPPSPAAAGSREVWSPQGISSDISELSSMVELLPWFSSSFLKPGGFLGLSDISGTVYFSNTDITTGLLKLVQCKYNIYVSNRNISAELANIHFLLLMHAQRE